MIYIINFLNFQTKREEWQIVFIISAVIFIVGNTVYIIFGSTKLQEWNDPDFLTKADTEKELPAKSEREMEAVAKSMRI